jgi:cathepsin L
MECAWFKKTGNLVSLSESQLVDCSKAYGNEGCDGGDMGMAMQYVIDLGYIDTEASYPYQAWDRPCKADPTKKGASIVSYYNITSESDVALEDASVNGTVSVAIDASSDDFQFYGGGVFEIAGCSKTDLDHGVLVYGYNYMKYNPNDVVAYWLVKNSWGRSWGDYGMIKMRKANVISDPWKNMCGIATQATQPTA